MATIYADSSDGYVTRWNQSTWIAARDESAGTANSGQPAHYTGIAAEKVAARSGGYVYNIFRSFLFFDTSAILRPLDSATLKIYGYSSTYGDVIVLKANQGATLGNGDFNSIVGWDETTDGAGGGNNIGNVTNYSAQITTWTTGGYNNITLNPAALADMYANDELYVAIVNYDYDLLDVEPTGYTSNRNGLYYTEDTAGSRDPYVDYTTSLITVDSVFFGANF